MQVENIAAEQCMVKYYTYLAIVEPAIIPNNFFFLFFPPRRSYPILVSSQSNQLSSDKSPEGGLSLYEEPPFLTR